MHAKGIRAKILNVLHLNDIFVGRVVFIIRNVSSVESKHKWFRIVRVFSDYFFIGDCLKINHGVVGWVDVVVLAEESVIIIIEFESTIIREVSKLYLFISLKHKHISKCFIIRIIVIHNVCLLRIPDISANDCCEVSIFDCRQVLVKTRNEVLIVFLSSIHERFKFSVSKCFIVFFQEINSGNIRISSVSPIRSLAIQVLMKIIIKNWASAKCITKII